MGADFESEDFGPGGVPDPAERTWRHPSEISAAARAEQAPTHVVSNSGLRVPPSVLLIAAGLAIGVVMAGYFIGDQRSTIPAETAAKTAATLPSGTETTTTSQALQTTTQLTVLGTDDSASVGTQGLITQIRARAVSRPEGVLTIYLDDETDRDRIGHYRQRSHIDQRQRTRGKSHSEGFVGPRFGLDGHCRGLGQRPVLRPGGTRT